MQGLAGETGATGPLATMISTAYLTLPTTTPAPDGYTFLGTGSMQYDSIVIVRGRPQKVRKEVLTNLYQKN